MDLDRFVSQQNVERYQKLREAGVDEPTRRIISRLLALELEKSKQLAHSAAAS
jgi:hypothetical protein